MNKIKTAEEALLPITTQQPKAILGSMYLFKDIGWVHKKDLLTRWVKQKNNQLAFRF